MKNLTSKNNNFIPSESIEKYGLVSWQRLRQIVIYFIRVKIGKVDYEIE